MNDRPNWFSPKRFGIGAGLPIVWQGWAVLAIYGLLIGIALLLFGESARALAIVIPATAALLIVAALTTRGGWRWRWSNDSEGGD